MKPLSVFTYYKNNIKKIIPIFLIIVLSILGVSITSSFLKSMYGDLNNLYGMYSYYYSVDIFFSPEAGYTNQQEFENEVTDLREEFKSNEDIEQVIETTVLTTNAETIFGTQPVSIFPLDESEQSTFLENTHLKLSEGRLPKNGKEVAIEETILTNKNLKVGDKFGSEIDEEDWLKGEFEIVGVLQSTDSRKTIKTGISFKDKNSRNILVTSFLLKPKHGHEDSLTNYLNKKEEEIASVTVETTESIQQAIDENFETINMVLWAVNIIVAVTITTSIALLQVIFFMQRSGEFGLLAAIGYSRGRIILKTLLESTIIVVIGWIGGILFSELIYNFLNSKMFAPKGMMEITIFEPGTLLFTVPIPIVVILFSAGTVLLKLRTMDPVSVIERKD